MLTVFAGCIIPVSAIDTLKFYTIDEISITQSRVKYYSEDKKVTCIDSMSMMIYKHADLGQLLSSEMPLNIRQYGAEGSITMVTARGLRADHTQLNWNGIPINSLTSGDNDLSMVPAGLIDEISLNFGAPGSLYGSGTFGAAIDVSNQPDWNNRINLDFAYQRGSFQSNKYKLNVKAGNKRIQYHLGAQYNKAENEFTPPGTDIYIKNNSFSSTGIMQNLFLNLPKNYQIQAGIWLQFKNKELPGYVNPRFPSYGYQNDSAFRTYLTWSKRFEKSKINFLSAYINDYMRYRYKPDMNDEQYFVNSTYNTKRFYNEASYKYYFLSGLTVDFGGLFQHATSDVSNYTQKVYEERFSIYSAAKYNLKSIILNASIREEIVDERKPKLLYSAGFKYKYNPFASVAGNFSNKYRTPTFNERYWRPGGDPDLLPETGWSTEMTFNNSFIKGLSTLSLNNTLFYTKLNNLVQWISGTELRPVSEKKVASSGYEFSADYRYKNQLITVETNLNYVFSRSVIKDHVTNKGLIGNYLIYAPVHSANINFIIRHSDFFSGFNTNFIGKQYTTENNDNKESIIKPFSISNFHVGANLKFRGTINSMIFTISNVFNTEYEVVKSYYMPGRAYYLSVSFGLNKI